MSEIITIKEKKGVEFQYQDFLVPFSKRETEIEVFVPFRTTLRVGWNARSTIGYLESYVVLPASITADKTEVVANTPDTEYGPVFLTSKQRVQIVVGDEEDYVHIELRADNRKIWGL